MIEVYCNLCKEKEICNEYKLAGFCPKWLKEKRIKEYEDDMK